MSNKTPAYIGFDPVNNEMFDKDGNVIKKSTLWPDSVIGEKKLFNFKLSTRNDDGTLDDYEEIAVGTTFEAAVDNDYNNPDYESFGNDVADWTNTTGSEYAYQTAISAEPYQVVEYDSIEVSALTRGTAGSLASGEWDYVGTTVTVRLSDDTNPSSKAEDYLQYVVSSYTPLFIFEDSTGFNAASTWYDYDTQSFRDPDPQKGELTFTANANTEDFKDRLENNAKVDNSNLQISLYETGTGEFIRMFSVNFVCKNRYLKNPLSLEVAGVNVYTKAEIDALLTAKVNIDVTAYTALSGLLDSHYLYIYDGSQGRYVTADKIKTYIGSTMTYSEITGTGVVNMRTDAQFDSSFTVGEMYRIGSGVTGLTDGTNTTNIDAGGFIVINSTVDKTLIDISTDVDFYNVYNKNPEFETVQLDTSYTHTGHTEGKVYWDSDCGCPTYDTAYTDVKGNLSQEFYVPPVYNDTGSQVDNGTVVYIDGIQSGQYPKIELAQNYSYDESRIIGMTTMNIPDSDTGIVTRLGIVRDIDTSLLDAGKVVYLTTDGGLTSTKPTGSSFIVRVGICLVSDASVGAIYIDPFANEYAAEINNQIGFPNITQSNTPTFDDATRTLSISPASTEFDFYEDGIQYRKTSTDSYVISNVEGMHLVYYDEGTLTETLDMSDGNISTLIRSKPFVAFVYWDADTSEHIYLGDERHQFEFGKINHSYNHFTRGAQFLSGLALNTLDADGDGNDNTAAQFGMDTGALTDEDLPNFFNSSIGSTDGYPIYYLDGSNPNSRKTEMTGVSTEGYPVLTDIEAGVGVTGRLVYNDNTGGTWSLITVADNDYVLCHIFANNDRTNGRFAVIGQADYTSISDARDGSSAEISNIILTGIVGPETIPIASVIYQTRNTYTNEVKARVRVTEEGEDYVDWRTTDRVAGSAATEHNNLAGRDAVNAHPDSAINLNTTPSLNLVGELSVEDVSNFIDAGIWNNISFDSASTQTIATGSFTPDQSSIILRGESNTDDDLDTITATTAQWFMCYVGGAENITVKHNTGNIYCPNGEDFIIPQNAKVSFWYDGSYWRTSGGSGSGGMSWSKITTDTNAIKDNGYLIDGSSNTVDLTLPSSPSSGDKVGYKITDDTNTVTIDRNSQPIEGLTSNLTPKAGSSVQLTYQDSTLGWTGVYNVEQTAFSGTFTDATLSSGVLTITHNLNEQYPLYAIYDNNDKKIDLEDEVTGTSTSVLTIDLSSFGTLSGTWKYKVIKAGGSGFTGIGATSPLTTKGDLWAYSTDDTRLPVGANNQKLVADSTESLGVKWVDEISKYVNFWLNAQACNARETNGAEAYTTELVTNDTMVNGFAFDTTTSEAIQFTWTMPSDYNQGTLKFKFKWTNDATSGTGTTTWAVRAKAVSNDDSIDGTWGTAQTVTDTFIATGDEHITSATSSLTIAGTPVQGDTVIFEIYRDISDTYTQDAVLTQIGIQYQTKTTFNSAW